MTEELNLLPLKQILDVEKEILSEKIALLLHEFYMKTYFSVSDIHLTHQSDGSGGTVLTKVTIEVKS